MDQMIWTTPQTRPDVSFNVCRMSNIGKHPKVKMLFEANKSIKVKNLRGSVSFPELRKLSEVNVVCYPDAT